MESELEHVILVDENDKEIGTMEKLEAHQKGLLHRAISVFIFNSKGEFLLQRRAAHKYHSANLWTNTCCSHPRPNESTIDAANRRLHEEMGLTANLKWFTQIIYKVALENNLFEHELDHVYVGTTDDLPTINPNEASEYKYLDTQTLLADIQSHPENYTYWFKELVNEVNSKFNNSQSNNSTIG